MKTLDPEALRAARLQAQRLRQRRERRRALLKHAFLILASFGMLYPLLWMVASSFKPESEIFSDLAIWPRHVDLSNYSEGRLRPVADLLADRAAAQHPGAGHRRDLLVQLDLGRLSRALDLPQQHRELHHAAGAADVRQIGSSAARG